MSIKSIIPSSPQKITSYFCTWGVQCDISFGTYKGGIDNHSSASDVLCEETLKKYIHNTDCLHRVRKDLIFMYDLGWDVPFGVDFDDCNVLGSMEVIEEKFPSCSGSPVEKLKKLNDLAIEAGWKGTGIWLPANAHRENEIEYTKDSLIKFYTDRLEWSKEAEIKYWKVDYGFHNNDPDFRGMITELAEKVAPGLVVEHARVSSGFNDYHAPGFPEEANGSGLYSRWDNGNVLKEAAAIMEKSHVLRLYDTSEELGIPSALDRASQMFRTFSNTGSKCIINCENQAHMGAALGCALGILAIPNKERNQYRKFERALMWHRIAPPMGAGKNDCVLSDEYLSDSWMMKSAFDWFDYINNTIVTQKAPAITANNMPLPFVTGSAENVPYVLASRHENGSYAIATLPRKNQEGSYFPKTRVTLPIEGKNLRLGVFGLYEQLTLIFSDNYKISNLYIQDLASNDVRDITSFVTIECGKITISGNIFEDICDYNGDFDDTPGAVLFIK